MYNPKGGEERRGASGWWNIKRSGEECGWTELWGGFLPNKLVLQPEEGHGEI